MHMIDQNLDDPFEKRLALIKGYALYKKRLDVVGAAHVVQNWNHVADRND